jgi:hypothetical protein
MPGGTEENSKKPSQGRDTGYVTDHPSGSGSQTMTYGALKMAGKLKRL